MTRPIDSSQVYRNSQLVPVDLLRLTTYTNRDAKTVDRRFYFARQPVRFDWNDEGTNREFWPVVQRIGTLATAMNHLGHPNDSNLLRKPLTVDLSNEPVPSEQGERLINVLRGYTLENATLEWTQLLLSERPTAGRLDLSALAGDEHTFWYRGRVRRVGPITEETVTLDCETELPSPKWTRELDQAQNDPKDFGKRLPAPFGTLALTRMTGTIVGWVTTLSIPLDVGETGTDTWFTDVTGFPASPTSFTVKVGHEEITGVRYASTDVTITARGVNGTKDQAHGAGEICIEMISEVVFTWAGHDDWGTGVGGATGGRSFLLNTQSGELVALTSFSFFGADTTRVPGQTRAILVFSTAQLRATIESVFGKNYGTIAGSSTDIGYVTRDVEVGSSMAFGDSMLNPQQIPTSPKLWGDPTDSGSNYYTVRLWWATNGMPGRDRVIYRWRMKIVNSALNSHVVSNQYVYARMELRNAEGSPLNGTAAEMIYTQAPYNQTTYGLVAVGSWHYPDAGTPLSAFESSGPTSGIYGRLYGDINGIDPALLFNADEWIEWTFAGIEVELFGVPDDAGGSFVGFNLDIWGNTYARLSPTTSPDYKCGDNALMVHPVDIIRYWIEEVGGQLLDYDSYDEAYANLGSAGKWSFDARSLGETWEQILARMAYEARSILVPEETAAGTVWKILTAPASYTWIGVTASAITEWEEFTEADQDVGAYATHATRFTFPYAPNWSKSETEDAFEQVVVINKDQNDVENPTTAQLTAAEAALGRIESEAWALKCTRDQATAEDVAGWYAHERIRVPARLFSIRGVPWWQAYNVEVGDRLYTTPPWDTEPAKCRVISYEKDPETESIDLRLVEIAPPPPQTKSMDIPNDSDYMRTLYGVTAYFLKTNTWTIRFRHKETIAVGSRQGADNYYIQVTRWDDSNLYKIWISYDPGTPNALRIIVWGSGTNQRKEWIWNADGDNGNLFDTTGQWYDTFIVWDGDYPGTPSGNIKVYTGQTGSVSDIGAPDTKLYDYDGIDQSGNQMKRIVVGYQARFKIHDICMWDRILTDAERNYLVDNKQHDPREDKSDYQGANDLDCYFRLGDVAAEWGVNYGDQLIILDLADAAIGLDETDIVTDAP